MDARVASQRDGGAGGETRWRGLGRGGGAADEIEHCVESFLRARGTRARLVAVTGYAQPTDVQRAAHAGFDGHIAKPAAPDTLLRALS